MPPAYDEVPPSGPPTQAFGTRTGRPLAPPPAEPERPPRRIIPWVALAVLVISAVAALVVLLVGGDDDDPSAGSTTTTTASSSTSSSTAVDDTSSGSTGGSATTGETTATSAPAEGALSAEETVEAYFEALAARDCETQINYVSEASWSEGGTLSRDEALAICEEEQASAPEYSLDSVEVTEGGGEGDDAAVAAVTVTADGQGTDVPVHLVREDGAWKIDFTQV